MKWDDMPSAFKRRIKSGVITNLGHLDIISFLSDAKSIFRTKIHAALKDHIALKVNTELAAEYIIKKSDSVSAEVKYVNTENAPIYETIDLEKWFNQRVRQAIQHEMEEFREKGSGWSLRQILSLIVNINQLNPMKGSSYIPLPDEISKKKACVNVRNDDNQCFKWAALSALHPQERNAERVSLYKKFEGELNFNDITFPVSLKQIGKFEKQNSISVNVYILQKYSSKYKVHPCHLTTSKKDRHVNLLLVQNYYVDENDEDENDDKDDANQFPEPKVRYVWIKSLSRLVRSQLTRNNNRCFICDRYLNFFNKEDKLRAHEIVCNQLNKCKIQLSMFKDSSLYFKHQRRQIKVPYIIYAEFEYLLKPIQDEKDTRIFQQHEAYSIGYYLQCSLDNERSYYRSYGRTEDGAITPAEWLIENLQALANELKEIYSRPEPMNLSYEEEQKFLAAKACHICKKHFSITDKKVRDHCHITEN